MNKVPQFVAISEMKVNQPKVLARLNNGPVILANRSKPAAVLISVAQWDSIVGQIEDLQARRRDEAAVGRTLTDREWEVIQMGRAAAMRGGPTISHEELNAKLKERYPHAADKI
jgi:prevent-host-death family protein